MSMLRPFALLLIASSLTGCGLAETGVAAGTGAAAEVEQAKQAREQLDKVKADLEAAQKAESEAREAALKANGG
jgi:multidrug efflux pump subunit AcrA (membrane-fusion protein)